MNTEHHTLEECLRENEMLRARLAEAEQTLQAIRNGEVDALMIAGPEGDRVYTLQGAETPYRFLVEEMNEGALLLGPEGMIRYANSRFAQWAGVPLEQVMGASLDRFFVSQECQPLKALLRAAQATPLRKEFHFESGAQASRPVGLSVRWLEREGISGVLAVVTDLSERRATEDALCESEERHRAFFDLGAVGMAYASPEGRFIQVNDKFCELTGYSRAELCGMAVTELTHPEDRQQDQEKLGEHFAGRSSGQTYSSEKRYVCKDGRTRWVSVTARMVSNSNGAPLYSIGIIQDITNHKNAEEALHQSEARLRQALGAAFAGVWDWNIQTGAIAWSPENYELYGLSPTQTSPTHADWERNVCPEDLPRIARAVEDALAGRTPEYRAEFRVRHPHKGERWILGMGRVECGPDGAPLRMAGLNIDITARKQMEDALRESEQRFRLLSEYSPDFVALHDLELRHLYVSPTIAQLVGQSQEAFLGHRMEDMGFSPEAVDKIVGALRRTLETDTECRDEFLFPMPDHPRYLLWRSVPLRGPGGKTQSILAVATDITARKQMEELLQSEAKRLEQLVQQRTTALAERAQLLELGSDAIIVRDAQDRVTYWNHGAEQMYGWRREEACGRVIHDLLQTRFPEPLPKIMTQLHQQSRWAGELVHTRRDGSLLTVATRWAVQRDQSGNAAILESNTDITDRKQIEEALHQRERTLQATNQALEKEIQDRKRLERQVLASVEREQRRLGQDLHDDLCQQLTAIEYASQTVARSASKRRKELAPLMEEIAGMVRTATVQARDLARGLSPLSLEADGLMTALKELAFRTRRIYRVECQFISETSVQISDQTAGIQLYRIAQEAVNNAARHSKAARIEVGLHPEGTGFILQITDDGVGIPQGVSQSNGMGLHIMRYRAAMIGGSLTVQSRGCGGTAVVCHVPGALLPTAEQTINEDKH